MDGHLGVRQMSARKRKEELKALQQSQTNVRASFRSFLVIGRPELFPITSTMGAQCASPSSTFPPTYGNREDLGLAVNEPEFFWF